MLSAFVAQIRCRGQLPVRCRPWLHRTTFPDSRSPKYYESPPRADGSWRAERPGDCPGQPPGDGLGSQGPDQGYALKLVKQFAGQVTSAAASAGRTLQRRGARRRSSGHRCSVGPRSSPTSRSRSGSGDSSTRTRPDCWLRRARFERIDNAAPLPRVSSACRLGPGRRLRRTPADRDGPRADWSSLIDVDRSRGRPRPRRPRLMRRAPRPVRAGAHRLPPRRLAPGRRCSTGSTPAITAARSCCASRTPTPSWRRPSTTRPSPSPSSGSGSTGTKGPFFQSERTELYLAAIDAARVGRGYLCDCTREAIDARNAESGFKGGYDGHCRDRTDVVDGDGVVVRFRTPTTAGRGRRLVRGTRQLRQRRVRGLRRPARQRHAGVPRRQRRRRRRHGITHVVRGEDLLNTTPKVLLLWDALGYGPPRPMRTCRCSWARIARSSRSARTRSLSLTSRRRVPARSHGQLSGLAGMGPARRRRGPADGRDHRAVRSR